VLSLKPPPARFHCWTEVEDSPYTGGPDPGWRLSCAIARKVLGTTIDSRRDLRIPLRQLLAQTVARVNLNVPEESSVRVGAGDNRFRSAALSRWHRSGGVVARRVGNDHQRACATC